MRKDELKVQDRLYGRAFDQKVELDNQKHIAVNYVVLIFFIELASFLEICDDGSKLNRKI